MCVVTRDQFLRDAEILEPPECFDDVRIHVEQQRERYLRRRAMLRPALEVAGFRIEHSEGSIYLWVTRGEDCHASVDFLARKGILVAPGDFYGAAASRHIRVALTATDERVATAAARLLET